MFFFFYKPKKFHKMGKQNYSVNSIKTMWYINDLMPMLFHFNLTLYYPASAIGFGNREPEREDGQFHTTINQTSTEIVWLYALEYEKLSA